MKNKHGNRSLPANRNYKDTIFRWLFSDKNNLLSLYNAIAGAHYQNPEALNIVTLGKCRLYGHEKRPCLCVGNRSLFV